jgi:uncharacterized protein (DUF2147 family)
MMKRAILLLSTMLSFAGIPNAANAAHEPAAVGFWLNRIQGWVVETRPCDSGLCGYLVGFRKNKSPGHVARDSQNPDPMKRSVPLCGLMLLGSFTPSKHVDGKWEDGWVYDPESGTTYTGEAQLIDADTIKLRGYVLIPLFGRTLTLTREAGTINPCSDLAGN